MGNTYRKLWGMGLACWAMVATGTLIVASDINFQSGVVNLSQVDVKLPGKAGLDLVISRSYNSKTYTSKPLYENKPQLYQDGAFMGNGWQSSISSRLVFASSKEALDVTPSVVIEHGAQQSTYEWSEDEQRFVSKTPGNFSYVVQEDTDTFVMYAPNGRTMVYATKFLHDHYKKPHYYYHYGFGSEKRMETELFETFGYYLTSVSDPYGHTITYDYETYSTYYEYQAHEYEDIPYEAQAHILNRYGESSAIRKYAVATYQWVIDHADDYSDDLPNGKKYMFSGDFWIEPKRPVSITDTYGRTVSFTYIPDGHGSKLKTITYPSIGGDTKTITYMYDDNGNFLYADNDLGAYTEYDYTAFSPTFKQYVREDDGKRYWSVEYPDNEFVEGSEGSVEFDDLKGWLITGVTSALGAKTTYEYEDMAFTYVDVDEDERWSQKHLVKAYSYPVVTSKKVQESVGDTGITYTLDYPRTSSNKLFMDVYKYSDAYSADEPTLQAASQVDGLVWERSEFFLEDYQSAYFKTLTISSSAHEAPMYFGWTNGMLTSKTMANTTTETSYTPGYKPDVVQVTKGGLSVTSTYAYDEYGNATTVTKTNSDGTLSTTTTLTYEQDPTLIDNRFYHLVKTKVTEDETGQQTPMQTYSYSDTGQVLTITESHNNETRTKVTNTYDNDGRIKTKTTPDQNTVSFTYDDTYSYNGQLAMKTQQSINTGASGAATTMTTTSILDFYTGAPLAETDANGATTTFTYDSYARPIKTTYADGTEKITAYSSDLTETTVQENGISITKKVDSLGRTLWVDNPEGVEDTYYIYTDALKRVAEVQKGTLSGGVLLNGRTVKSYVYDSYGRVTDSHNPNWGTTSIEFEDDTKQQIITDWAGRKTIKHYNDFNQVTKEELYADTNHSITKTYGASSIGLDSYVKDGRDFYHQTEGVPGWSTTIYHPSTGLGNKDEQEELTYRADGSLTERKIIGRNNTYLTYSYDYDSIGRLTDVYLTEDTDSSSYGHTQVTSKASSSPKETYIYDEDGHGYSVGRLTTSTNDDVEQIYTYDLLGRVTNEVTTIKGASTSTFTNGNNQDVTLALSRTFYDDNGQLKTLTYDDDTAITYTYDNLNRLDSIYYKDTLIAAYTYTTKGTIDTITYGNNMSQAFGYEKDVLITDITTTHPTNGKQIVESYEYDDKGHIVTNRIPAVGYGYASTRNYTYTDRGELESVTQTTNEDNNGSSSTTTTLLYDYSYDNNGNVLTAKQPSGFGIAQLSLTPDTLSDELVSITKTQLTSNGSTTGTPENISYVYDAAGNMTKKTMGDGDIFLTYNWQQQVKTYHENYGDSLTANYIYNNDRERVYSHTQIPQGGRRTTSSEDDGTTSGANGVENKETYYIWDAGQIIGEKNTDGEIYVKYIYSGNEKMAMVRKSSAGNDRIYYFINNAQGTPRVIVDGNGTIQQNQQTDPWGNLEAGVNHKNEVNFTGKKKDRLSGLYYFNQRYYDADAYRFVQKDPAEQYLNPYVYGANNPLSYVDPDGEFFFLAPLVGAMVQGAVYSAGISALANMAAVYASGAGFDAVILAGFQGAVNGAVSGALTGGLGFGIGAVNSYISGAAGAVGLAGQWSAAMNGMNMVMDTVQAVNITQSLYNGISTGINSGDWSQLAGTAVHVAGWGLDKAGMNPLSDFARDIGRSAAGMIDPRFGYKNHVISSSKDSEGNKIETESHFNDSPKPEDLLDKKFKDKGFEPRGPNPAQGKGGYVNPKTNRSYHIDIDNRYKEAPHIDVNRPRGYKGPLKKKKIYLQ